MSGPVSYLNPAARTSELIRKEHFMQDEYFLTLAEAARHLPNNPHPSTVYRWYAKGVQCGETRVYLDARPFGRKLYVTLKAVYEFTAQVAEAKRRQREKPAAQHEAREAKVRQAQKRLDQMGV